MRINRSSGSRTIYRIDGLGSNDIWASKKPHGFLTVEHDPLFYEDAQEMAEYVAKVLRQAFGEATILLLRACFGSSLQKMTKLAGRVFCFYEMLKPPACGGQKLIQNVIGPGYAGDLYIR